MFVCLERSQIAEILDYSMFKSFFQTWKRNALEEPDSSTRSYEIRSPEAVRKILRWFPLQEVPSKADSLEEAVRTSSPKDDPFSNHSSNRTQKCKRKGKIPAPVQEAESQRREATAGRKSIYANWFLHGADKFERTHTKKSTKINK